MLHNLGVAMVAVGAAAALITEAIALGGTVSGRWGLTDFYRRPDARRWFFYGLGLLVLGIAIVYG